MSTTQVIIDVWDARTLDSGLLERLEPNADLIRAYFDTDHKTFLSHDRSRDPGRSIFRPENPHAAGYYEMLSWVTERMKERTIRAFHYTRLTQAETAKLMQHGIHLSTPETLRQRLDSVVASGDL